MASNAIILMDLIPLAYIFISLGHLLIDPSLGGAMAITYGEREAVAVDERDGSATVCVSTANLGGYAVTKSPCGTELLPLRVPQDPLRQAMCGTMMVVDRAPFRMGRKRRSWSKVG